MLSRRIKHLILALTVALSANLVVMPALASADFKSDACSGVNSLDGTNSATCPTGGDSKLTTLFRTIIGILSAVVGLIAVIMVIVGGFKFITSGGDSSKAASARSTITYALIGLVVAVLAQILIHFVLFKVSGAAACKTNNTISATSAQCKK